MSMDLIGAGLHIIKGAALGSLGYMGGLFMQGVATSIGFTALANTNIPIVAGSLLFVGYAVDKVIEYHEKSKKEEAAAKIAEAEKASQVKA